MQPVAVRILHPPSRAAGPLARALAAARSANAERLADRFTAAGCDDVVIVRPEGRGSFAAWLRETAALLPARGLVVLGSGAIPLARDGDVEAFVRVASSGERRALANNRYSADVVAIGEPVVLRSLPDLPGDNAVPRWLAEVAGFQVGDLRARWRLAVDLDSPLDVLLVGGDLPADADGSRVRDRLRRLRAVGRDRRAEVVVAGRTSSGSLRWLERSAAARIRALVEERGLRASSRAALAWSAGAAPQRPPRSALGMVLDDRGAGALGATLAELGDGAVIDTRVLLAHRLGVDEGGWPQPEDRFASDLLLPERIADPWLRELTASALDAAIPVLLGGHSLVGPGVRLAFGSLRSGWP